MCERKKHKNNTVSVITAFNVLRSALLALKKLHLINRKVVLKVRTMYHFDNTNK